MKEFEKKIINNMQSIAKLKGSHLLVACSGGMDSMALLHFLHKVKDFLQCTVSCVHVDHMLRGEESYGDLLHVQTYCEKHQIPFYGRSIPIPAIISRDGGNIQAVCREERYTYFEEIFQQANCDMLVTAHHVDDHVENILMSLTKNRSLNGLKGIDFIRMNQAMPIMRPFLFVTKQEIRTYLEEEGVEWREDPSNQKNDYARNRFRNDIIPLLKLENEQFTTNVAAIAQQIREDDEYLMTLAEGKYKNIVTKLAENNYKLSVEALNREPLALQRRILLILLNYVYGNFHSYPSAQIISQIVTLCQTTAGHAEIHLPENFVVRRNYDMLEIKPNKESTLLSEKKLLWNEWISFGQIQIYFGEALLQAGELNEWTRIYYGRSAELAEQMTVRSFEPGDRLLIAGMEQPKKISRIFIDAKIPSEKRKHYPVLQIENKIIAVGWLRHHVLLSKSKRPTDDCVIIFQGDSL